MCMEKPGGILERDEHRAKGVLKRGIGRASMLSSWQTAKRDTIAANSRLTPANSSLDVFT